MDDLILRAVQLAKRAHAGQVRKYHGRQYVEHPARVAARVMLFDGVGAEEVAAALLHDVIEDCDYDADDLLAEGMPQRTVDLVMELTNPSSEDRHKGYSRRQRKWLDREHIDKVSDAAKRIKLADVLDNIRDLSRATPEFASRFVAEKVLLLDRIKHVDEQLAEEIYEAIEQLGYGRDHRDRRVN